MEDRAEVDTFERNTPPEEEPAGVGVTERTGRADVDEGIGGAGVTAIAAEDATLDEMTEDVCAAAIDTDNEDVD